MHEPTHIIGVCLSRIQEEERLQCIQSLNHFAVSQGYRLFIYDSNSDFFYADIPTEIGEVAVFQLIQFDLLDAMILFPDSIKNDALLHTILDGCRNANVPVLTVDKPLEGCINFRFDYANTFEMLCRHIVVAHHAQRVYMIAGVQGNDFSEERVHAFRNIMAECRVPAEQIRIGYGNFWEDPTIATLTEWFEKLKLEIPDAIICANDVMAITTIQYLQNHGYRVPEDCIVTGFDGIDRAKQYVPHVTTCARNYERMGKLLVETIENLNAGKAVEDNVIVNFHILYSQSCGCEDAAASNANEALQYVMNQLRLSNVRQDLTCQLQSAVTSMSSLSELPDVMLDKFVFHTFVFGLNDDIFRAPDFGEDHKGKNAYSEKLNVLYQRYFWTPEEPCIIEKAALIPHLPNILKRENPIIFRSLHFLDLILGYCVFQTEMTYDAYEKVNSFMNAMGSSLGIFRSQMHTKSINMQLISANNELEKLYVHDHMTGLLNRRGFYRQFRQQLEESYGKDLQVIIISADLDGLKHINDVYGHMEGDSAIITVGKALMTSAIQGEVCSRFGGDEFTVAGVIMDTDSNYFNSFRTRFRNYLQQYNEKAGNPYLVESSIGYCIQPLRKDIDIDQMIKIADDRMYEDKVSRRKERR